jgi:hypothetical protein
MATIFHNGFKILRQEIGNRIHAEIADFLYFRVKGSKFYDKKGEAFFLLPNVDHIIDTTGICRRSCQRALSVLNEKDWIKKVRMRCTDGAVRLKIYVTNKFNDIMLCIEKKLKSKSQDITNKSVKVSSNGLKKLAKSESAKMAISLIKEKTKKEETNKEEKRSFSGETSTRLSKIKRKEKISDRSFTGKKNNAANEKKKTGLVSKYLKLKEDFTHVNSEHYYRAKNATSSILPPAKNILHDVNYYRITRRNKSARKYLDFLKEQYPKRTH